MLSEVFQALSSTDPETRQQVTRLVSRRQADWHGPLDMAIPIRQVLFVETIGPESRIGKAIADAERAKPAHASAAPAAATH